ncbi:MAG: hypothetical protein ACTSW7_00650 [Candidatus Thorarchaeota archaeon]|nr:hypothetical protein [Thermoplasmatales archaeon]
METYSSGETPIERLKEIFEEHGNYNMSLVGEDRDVMIHVVNQGIDAYLEAFTESSFSDDGYRLTCDVSPKDMLVLLRRLHEGFGMDYDLIDHAWSLRSGILDTMDVEEL